MEPLIHFLEQLLASPSTWAFVVIISVIALGMLALGIVLARAMIPVTREFGELMDTISKNFQAQRDGMEAQRQSWESLIVETKALNEQREKFFKGNISDLQEELGTLHKQSDEICKLLESRDRELNGLRRQINELETKLEEKEQEIQAIRAEKNEEIQNLKNEIQAIQRDRLEIAKERDDLKKTVGELSKKIEELSKGDKKTP